MWRKTKMGWGNHEYGNRVKDIEKESSRLKYRSKVERDM